MNCPKCNRRTFMRGLWISGKGLLARWPGVTPKDLVARLMDCIEEEEAGAGSSPLHASVPGVFDKNEGENVPGPYWNKRNLGFIFHGINPFSNNNPLLPPKAEDAISILKAECGTIDLQKIIENEMYFNLYEVKEYELDDPTVMGRDTSEMVKGKSS